MIGADDLAFADCDVPRSLPGHEPRLAVDEALPTIAPREGDGVLMRAVGRRRVAGHHIGVWCAPSGVPHVLHCLKEIGVCLHPIRALARHGLEMTGVYRWL